MWFIGKLSRDKRGIGSLVGAAFLILILMSGFAFYMLSVNVTNEYRETLGTMDQLDLKREQEKIEFVSVSTTDEDKLDITVENTGPYQTHLIWLGVFDETPSPPTQNYYELNSYINPAETETGIGSTEMDDEIIEEHQYTIQVVTELGNTFIYSYPEPPVVSDYLEPQPWVDIGKLRFYFEYYSINFTSESYHDPTPGWVIPGGESIMFHVKIVSTGKTPITLRKHCVFYALEYREGSPGSSQGSHGFFIVSPDSEYPGHNEGEGKMYEYDEVNDPYVLQPNPDGKWWLGGPPVIVKFGGEYTGGEGKGDKPVKLPNDDFIYLVSIGLFYKYTENGEEHQYGQNIPYVAIQSYKT